jgi:hypothetical protein
MLNEVVHFLPWQEERVAASFFPALNIIMHGEIHQMLPNRTEESH